jgi:hypothetical protein
VCPQRSPSFLERTQGITGTRKRLDDALVRARSPHGRASCSRIVLSCGTSLTTPSSSVRLSPNAQDDAVPCAMTPKRLRGAEDMFANMRIDE